MVQLYTYVQGWHRGESFTNKGDYNSGTKHSQNPTPNTPNVLFVTNNKDYSFKVSLVTFCADYPTK